MPEHTQYEEEAIVNPETHREKSDVNVRALLLFIAAFIVFAAISHGLVFLLFRRFARMARVETSAPLTAIASPAGASTPSLPRLQPFPGTAPPYRTTPAVDMEDLRRAEEQALQNPAWIDRQKGIVRLPIDVAKQLVVRRGLPVEGEGRKP